MSLLACCFYPNYTNPQGNVLLEPEITAERFLLDHRFSEGVFLISCVALAVLTIGAAFYVATTYPIPAALISAGGILLAVKWIFDTFLFPLRESAQHAIEAHKFELNVAANLEALNQADDSTFQNHCEEAGLSIFKNDENLRDASPLIARANAYHSIALDHLAEAKRTFEITEYQNNFNKLYQSETPIHQIEREDLQQRLRPYLLIAAQHHKKYHEALINEALALYFIEHLDHSGNVEELGHVATETSTLDMLLGGQPQPINSQMTSPPLAAPLFFSNVTGGCISHNDLSNFLAENSSRKELNQILVTHIDILSQQDS